MTYTKTFRMGITWMHSSQGRDRWFGRIQSAPTVGYVDVGGRNTTINCYCLLQ
ncbi:hypothetical protein [Phocaeicola sp.]